MRGPSTTPTQSTESPSSGASVAGSPSRPPSPFSAPSSVNRPLLQLDGYLSSEDDREMPVKMEWEPVYITLSPLSSLEPTPEPDAGCPEDRNDASIPSTSAMGEDSSTQPPKRRGQKRKREIDLTHESSEEDERIKTPRRRRSSTRDIGSDKGTPKSALKNGRRNSLRSASQSKQAKQRRVSFVEAETPEPSPIPATVEDVASLAGDVVGQVLEHTIPVLSEMVERVGGLEEKMASDQVHVLEQLDEKIDGVKIWLRNDLRRHFGDMTTDLLKEFGESFEKFHAHEAGMTAQREDPRPQLHAASNQNPERSTSEVQVQTNSSELTTSRTTHTALHDLETKHNSFMSRCTAITTSIQHQTSNTLSDLRQTQQTTLDQLREDTRSTLNAAVNAEAARLNREFAQFERVSTCKLDDRFSAYAIEVDRRVEAGVRGVNERAGRWEARMATLEERDTQHGRQVEELTGVVKALVARLDKRDEEVDRRFGELRQEVESLRDNSQARVAELEEVGRDFEKQLDTQCALLDARVKDMEHRAETMPRDVLYRVAGGIIQGLNNWQDQLTQFDVPSLTKHLG